MITMLHMGIGPNDYSITWWWWGGGVSCDPKSDFCTTPEMHSRSPTPKICFTLRFGSEGVMIKRSSKKTDILQ